MSFYIKTITKTNNIETPENLKNWLILDNGSTLHLMGNKALLKDLRKSNEYTRIQSNGDILKSNVVVSIDGLGNCVYHPNAVTNIVSLSELIKTSQVTFDSEKGPYFTLHKPNGELIIFQQSKNVLFFITQDRKI